MTAETITGIWYSAATGKLVRVVRETPGAIWYEIPEFVWEQDCARDVFFNSCQRLPPVGGPFTPVRS